ncbi:MAG: single-stranded DNA-binding protein [Victivallales bacterium]|nr:single-stranded DNA-binding protein [Victivallales bacterium]
MASLNKVILLGNLTRTPELRYTPSGSAVCEFGLAVNRKYLSNGQEKEETCFVNISVWGKQGESCQRYLEKGSAALIEGRLQYEQWEDRDTGKKRSTLRVVAERVQFVGGRREDSYGQGNDSQGSRQDSDYQNRQSPRRYDAPSGTGNAFPEMPEDAFGVNNDAEDDIPF